MPRFTSPRRWPATGTSRWSDRLRLAWPALALSRLNPEDPWLDTVTFGSWLSRHGQSDVAIDRLWDLIALPTLNVHAAEASLALAVKVFRTGLLDQADAGDVGWSTVPLTELHGDYAARALDAAGVETVLGARVQHVAAAGRRWARGRDRRAAPSAPTRLS